MKAVLSIAMIGLFATPLAAQAVSDCEWETSARNLVEPWEDYSRTFAEGEVRLAMLDMIEPAVGAMYLLVLSPPRDQFGDRQCKTIGVGNGGGFGEIMWDELVADYDPAVGLIFKIPVTRFDPTTDRFPVGLLTFTLNQSTGNVNVVSLENTK